MNVLCLLCKRCRIVADREDYGVALNLASASILICDNNRAVLDLLYTCFKMYGHLICIEEIAKEGGVCQRNTGGGDKIVLHLYDGRLFALEVEVVSDLASCKSAANNNYALANRLVLKKVVNRLNCIFRAGNRNSLRGSARCNNYLVSLDKADVLDLGVKLDLDRKLCNLASVPGDKLAILLLKGGGSRSNEHAAKFIALLEDSHAVTALCKEDSRLHTADTTADNSNALSLFRGLNVILLRLHGLGVDRATRKSHRIGKILRVIVSLGGGEVEAACVTADTGSDILKSVFDKLGDPLAVSKELSCHSNAVDLALGNSRSTNLGLHAACAYYGNVNELLYVRYVLKVAVLGHIHRGMRPVPRVVSTVVGVKHIVACILKISCGSLGFLHSTANLGVFLTGNGTLAEALHLGLNRVAERNGEVLATLCLDSLNYFCGEAVSVLKATAVFVGTLVEELYCKLVKKIALMYRVNLNSVNARIHT